ncbi:MAG: D-alanyl-D-alanine carboxypeptidase/D-alanyl-D-alanine-endopeptidase [Ignavibacterium sp.]|nr:D-alanyl-D-alanine carboxypeptidase/D-alanyl-D-alanine-endopeptidase [Ignavibacterium sp.]
MLKIILVVFIYFNSIALPQSIKKELEKYLNKNIFDTTLIAIQVDNLSKGKTIFKKNEKLLLHPASNMKLLTSAAAIVFLGNNFKFKTYLLTNGNILNDTLYGDLIFYGGCDPQFQTNDFYPILENIKSKGISYIKGNLIGDVSFKDNIYWGKGWMWDDDPSSDAPRLAALNLNKNCITVNITNGKLSIVPKTNFVKVIHQFDDDKFIVDRNWLENKNEIIIKNISNKSASFSINIVNPEMYFLTVFREVLDSNGIKISGETRLVNQSQNALDTLYCLERDLNEVLLDVNKNSDNLSAEMLLLVLGEKYFGKPATFEKGINVLEMLIDSLRIKPKNYRIVDGSGVSHYNLLSVELIIKLLNFMHNQSDENFTTFLNSLPISGVDGTLKNRMKEDETFFNVFAKTGTLSGVSCLSGYIKNKSGDLISFSIFIQNFVGSAKRYRDIQDEICKIIYLNK